VDCFSDRRFKTRRFKNENRYISLTIPSTYQA
jgi:hypothetical protein